MLATLLARVGISHAMRRSVGELYTGWRRLADARASKGRREAVQRWRTWSQQSSGRRIAAALVIVGGWTVLVKLAAFLKDALIASYFGTGDALDAFLIAMVVPQFAVTVVGASLNVALIPTYIEVRERQGPEEANRLLSNLVVIAAVFLLVAAGALAAAAPYLLPLLASGFGPEKLALSYALYWLLLAVLVLHGIATVWAAVLNALNRFAVAAAVPMATSFLTIAAVLTLTAEYGVHTLAVGSVGGAFMETALIGWYLSRERVPLLPRWTGMNPAARQVIGQYVPVMAGAVLMAGTGLVSYAMAGMLEPGSVSALAYGGKVANLLLGIGATAVSTAFLPYLSKMAAVADWNGLRRTITRSTGWLLGAAVPSTALLMYWSEPIVALLFQRGAFTEADTRLVAHVQVMFLLQIPAYVVGMVFVRLVSALKANAILMWCNMVNLLLCIALTYLFVRWMGVAGIALATSLIYFVNTGMLALLAWRILRRQENDGTPRVVPALDAV